MKIRLEKTSPLINNRRRCFGPLVIGDTLMIDMEIRKPSRKAD
jgi:hypothetical protein